MKNKSFIIITVFIFFFIFSLSQFSSAAQVHRVKPGESLFLISRDYGVTIEEIIETNNLRNTEIVSRQVLIIPPQSVYYVREGDTLYRIAQLFKIDMDNLIAENEILQPDLIWPGLMLRIPWRDQINILNTSFQIYEVKSGDSLYRIANKTGVSIKTLVILNNITDANNLQIGQILNIPEYSFSQLRNMYPDHFFLQGGTDSPRIALTFDDGPEDNYTLQVLDVLAEFDVPATFFYMGERVERYPEVVERTIAEGHVIANHSWSHPQLTRLSGLEVYDEIKDTEVIMEEITGLRSGLIRPPYGLVSQKIVEQLKALDYRIIQWSVDSVDWRDRDVDQILINTIPDIRNGAIVLFHTASGGQSLQATVDALPELIFTLQIQGYEFVTVDELLDIPAYLN